MWIPEKVLSVKKNFKLFVGKKSNKVVTPLCVLLLKISGYLRNSDYAKNISFLFKEKKNCWKTKKKKKKNKLWEKEIDSNSLFYKKYLRTKIKSDVTKLPTNLIVKYPRKNFVVSEKWLILFSNWVKVIYLQAILEECK